MFTILQEMLLLSGIEYRTGLDSDNNVCLIAFGNGRLCEVASYTGSPEDPDEYYYEILFSNGFVRSYVSLTPEDTAHDLFLLIHAFVAGTFSLSTHAKWRRKISHPRRKMHYQGDTVATGPISSWPNWFSTEPPGGLFTQMFPFGASIARVGTKWVDQMPVLPGKWLESAGNEFELISPWSRDTGIFTISREDVVATMRLGRDWLECQLSTGCQYVVFSTRNESSSPLKSVQYIMQPPFIHRRRSRRRWRFSIPISRDYVAIVL